MSFKQTAEPVLTLENAQKWQESPEQFLFCEELLSTVGLEISLTDDPVHAERAVAWMERRFTSLLRDAALAQAEYERQCFSADMNEWYGRGNHPF